METHDEYWEKNMNIEIVFSDVDGTLLNKVQCMQYANYRKKIFLL